MSLISATDQLSAAARDSVPKLIESALHLRSNLNDRDQTLAALTMHFMQLPPAGVAALAADVLLRLVEEQNR